MDLMGDDGAGELEVFAKEVGGRDHVACVGGRTQWHVGGTPEGMAREVRAPTGVVTFDPAEMTVRVRGGTTVADLDAALAEGGQMVPLDPTSPELATVGGVLSVGHSGSRRLRFGPIRDTLLEARFVNAGGKMVKAGGPVVKNVTGFDLCRLLVGSLGTNGFLAEVVLRAQPRPPVSRWFVGEDDPAAVRRRLFRPSSILWDGSVTSVLLEGHDADVRAEQTALGPQFTEVADGPKFDDFPYRQSLRPISLAGLQPNGAAFIAEIGVGTVHWQNPQPRPVVEDEALLDLNQRVKALFDPLGRLNPGRRVLS